MFFKKFFLLIASVAFGFSLNAASWCEMLTVDMSRYDQGDNLYHSGNVMQHSVWVLRNVASWIREKEGGRDVVWLEGLDMEKYKQTLILIAFLHDIGKCGDNQFTPCSAKTDHDEVGFRYLLESLKNKKSSYLSKTTELNEFDFAKLFEDFGLNNDALKLSAIATRMHYGLGDVMKGKCSNKSIQTYLDKLKTTAGDVGYPVSMDLIRICILISAADVKGFNPIDYFEGMFEDLKFCHRWAEGIGVDHSSSHNGWEIWGYGKQGPVARSAILKYYNEHVLEKSLGDLKKKLKQLKLKLETLSTRLNLLNSKLLKVN